MEQCVQRDEGYKKALRIMKLVYLLAGIGVALFGFFNHSPYQWILAFATFSLYPGLYFVRRIFKWNGGWALETFIYAFSLLGWTLGGAGEVYALVPYYDKFVHCLSGLFVSIMALAFFHMLERGHSTDGMNPATEPVFVFAVSMAVAGLFELCEFTLAPIMQRDLQHVMDTGVADTMWDMIVCLIGTIAAILLIVRSNKGKHDMLTDSARAFALQNPRHT